MARTKLTIPQIVTGYVSSSLNNVPTFTPSGSTTVAYSTNNNSVTLAPGVYMITATAACRFTLSGQDSTFGVDVYDGSSIVLSNNFTTMSATSGAAWPSISTQGPITLTTQKTLTVRIFQTYGSSAAVSNVHTTITFTKTG